MKIAGYQLIKINIMINEHIKATHDYYMTDRSQLLQLVRGTPMRVLELGCGAGTLLKELKSLGCTYVCGIEVREDIAIQARDNSGANDVIVADIEKSPPDFPAESFDLIIASHVLEHMVDPWKVTNQLVSWLKPGGQFVGAIPNVRHIKAVLPLVFSGTWKYEETGLLDWTHLRFFTRAEIQKLIVSANLEIEGVYPEFGGPRSQLLRLLSLGLLTDFVAYAYRFSAWKK